jgi:effector-binding domain-containing protein
MHLEATMTLVVYDVQRRTLTHRDTAVCRGEMPAAELPGWLASSFHAVEDYLKRTRVEPTGPPFARFTFLGDTVAVEAGFPVPEEIAGEDLVEPSALPDGPAAVTTHTGRYEDLDRAYTAIHDWLDTHGYSASSPHWEVYYTDPNVEPDSTHWYTDVIQPYRAT